MSLVLLSMTGCGRAAPSVEVSRAPDSVTVQTRTIGDLGTVLSYDGQALYVFPPDHRAAVLCDGACQGTWPSLVVRSGGRVIAGAGADQANLGVLARPGSSDRVVTYNSWPLYRYAGDVDPGKANGQALSLSGGPWYVLAPSVQAVVHDPAQQP